MTAEPSITDHEHALFVPMRGDWAEAGWGLYDAGDRLILPAARWIPAVDGSPWPTGGRWTAPLGVEGQAEEGGFVYGGLLEPGIAGLVFGALSRFWSHATRPGRRRVLFHTRAPLGELFDDALVRSAMAAVGWQEADCVTFETPVRLASVTVPAPSIEEGRLAHPAYARLTAALGIRLTGRTVPADLGRAPVHVSSAREPAPAIEDEEEFDRQLEREGVAVLHPSGMSLASLVARVRSAPLLSSTAPSSMAGVGDHAAAFRDAGSRMVLCATAAPRDGLNIDAACGHDALYLRPAWSAGPVELAAAYLRAMRRLIAVRQLPCELAGGGGPASLAAAACTTSDDRDGSVAFGGLLTGMAQLRVADTQYPWWQADLGTVAAVDAVDVHGPIEGEERCTSLNLFGSADGRDWSILGQRDGADPIGGIDGRAHRFDAPSPWRVRFVRLQSRTGVLVLDQVEILSRATATAEILEVAL